MDDKNNNAALRRGVLVFVGLAVMTVVEYFLGVVQAPSIWLWATAVLKAGVVVWFFMHIFRLWNQNEGEH